LAAGDRECGLGQERDATGRAGGIEGGVHRQDVGVRVGRPVSGHRVSLAVMDWKLELIQVPVNDVDRAIAFYVDQVGFHLDHDYQVTDDLRFVQLTPVGSAASIALGTGLTDMAPGFLRGLQLVVDNAETARAELLSRGVEVSEVDVQPWGSFVYFADPDGNTWSVQQP
jgi:catechol 2,3-dioxygenase-like lactoylglutathione lyase family enzyme